MNGKWIMGCIVTICSGLLFGQANIDENFDEWHEIAPAYSDDLGDVASTQIDFDKLWLTNDDEFLFIRFNFQNVNINLQSDNRVRMYIDTDSNSSTGTLINGIGAEIEFRFGDRFGIAVLPELTTSVEQNDIGLISMPTVTGQDFELSIRRDASINGIRTRLNGSIRVQFVNGTAGDRMPNNNETITYNFRDNPALLGDYSWEKQDISNVRIVSLNALRDLTFSADGRPSAERMFKAVNPDIIALQEVYSTSTSQARNYLNQWLPLENGVSWFVDKVEPDIIICSREPILTSDRIDGNGAFYVQYGNHQLLIVNAHLPCCNNESQRQEEVDNIMSFIRASKNGQNDIPIPNQTPIVILGDMNFVGFKQQRSTLLDGNIINENTYGSDFIPDWDGTEFDLATMTTTGTPFGYTWRNPFSDFWPGRLDYIIYSGSSMQLTNAFAIDSKHITPSELLQTGILSPDSDEISDHLMCVADFDLDMLTSTSQINPINQTYNTFIKNEKLIINQTILDLVDFKWSVISSNGVLMSHGIKGDESQVELDVTTWPTGIYYVIIKTNQGKVTRQLFKP